MASIPMMGGAYFVGRIELLNWLNDLLQLDYTKVEETCSGAAVCQLMDIIYPGKVPLGKVNFNAKQEYEYLGNYKVLQRVFDQQQIDKRIDIPKLTRGKYQDNLEFMQWAKGFFDNSIEGPVDYDAVARRREVKSNYLRDKDKSCGPVSRTKPSVAQSSKPSQKIREAPAKPKESNTKPKEAPKAKETTSKTKENVINIATRQSSGSRSSARAPVPEKSTTVSAKRNTKPSQPTKAKAPVSFGSPELMVSNEPQIEIVTVIEPDTEAIEKLENEIEELKYSVEGLENERNFYFKKLRDIEILCQDLEENETIREITKILYATDEDEKN